MGVWKPRYLNQSRISPPIFYVICPNTACHRLTVDKAILTKHDGGNSQPAL